MELNDVLMAETFAEPFPMPATRLVITAGTIDWARTAATAGSGYEGR